MVRQLDDQVLVSGQITPADVPELKQRGVAMIINNRPDGEEPGQPLGADIEAAAQEAGIEYRYIPIQRGIGPGHIEPMREAFEESREGKILAFCRSGSRSALVWAVARCEQGVPRDEVERQAAQAGVDLTPVSHLL
jgi:uncharacterized protein (TIGR01244 family)